MSAALVVIESAGNEALIIVRDDNDWRLLAKSIVQRGRGRCAVNPDVASLEVPREREGREPVSAGRPVL